VQFSLQRYEDVFALRGSIYRRAVDERNMPPSSARNIFGLEISASDRDKLEEWLLGGAPQ
jgi:hypothetical protein